MFKNGQMSCYWTTKDRHLINLKHKEDPQNWEEREERIMLLFGTITNVSHGNYVV